MPDYDDRIAFLESEIKRLSALVDQAHLQVRSLTLRSETGSVLLRLEEEDEFVQLVLFNSDTGEPRAKLAASKFEAKLLLFDDDGFARICTTVDENNESWFLVQDEELNVQYQLRVSDSRPPSVKLQTPVPGSEELRIVWESPS